MPTKEQVLKRLAEIEGRERFTEWEDVDIEARTIYSGTIEYNPLDNPSDWAVLIEKYRVDIQWIPSDEDALGEEHGLAWEAEVWDYSDLEDYKLLSTVRDKSLPWAICLAIIEANGGMGDE